MEKIKKGLILKIILLIIIFVFSSENLSYPVLDTGDNKANLRVPLDAKYARPSKTIKKVEDPQAKRSLADILNKFDREKYTTFVDFGLPVMWKHRPHNKNENQLIAQWSKAQSLLNELIRTIRVTDTATIEIVFGYLAKRDDFKQLANKIIYI